MSERETGAAVTVGSPEADALIRWYECERKARFDAWRAAEDEALATMQRCPVRNDGRNTRITAYECSHCGGFHIGGAGTHLRQASTRRRLRKALRLWRIKHG